MARFHLLEIDLTDRSLDGAATEQPLHERSRDAVLARALGRARLTILWERLWPALATVATAVGLFLAVSWDLSESLAYGLAALAVLAFGRAGERRLTTVGVGAPRDVRRRRHGPARLLARRPAFPALMLARLPTQDGSTARTGPI